MNTCAVRHLRVGEPDESAQRAAGAFGAGLLEIGSGGWWISRCSVAVPCARFAEESGRNTARPGVVRRAEPPAPGSLQKGVSITALAADCAGLHRHIAMERTGPESCPALAASGVNVTS